MLSVDRASAPASSALSSWRSRRRSIRRRRPVLAAVSAVYVVVLAVFSLLTPWLPVPDPTRNQGKIVARPLGDRLLGTDQLGRDILSRLLWGARVSIFIALTATVIALVVGMVLGLVAGYFRKWPDVIISAFVDVVLAFPTLIFLMVIIAVRGPSSTNLIVGLSIVLSTGFTRLARAGAIVFTQREFVRAARGLGATNVRVLFRELMPNVLPALMAFALTATAHMFLVEGSLSFLGLGVPPPTPSWGSMIQGGRPIFRDAPHVVLIPAITMSLTIVSFNIIGDYFRHGRGLADRVQL